MNRFQGKYRIESTRIPDWDYAEEGWYFVTICTKNHLCSLGKVINDEVQLSEIGRMVSQYWQEIPSHFPNAQLDEFIVMPNHLHGIVVLEKHAAPTTGRDVACYVSTNNAGESGKSQYSAISPKPGSLSTIIRSFKAAVTLWCRKNGYPQYAWQPRYYDHIIRNDKSFTDIQHYIFHNAAKWESDEYHPAKLNL